MSNNDASVQERPVRKEGLRSTEVRMLAQKAFNIMHLLTETDSCFDAKRLTYISSRFS